MSNHTLCAERLEPIGSHLGDNQEGTLKLVLRAKLFENKNKQG